MRALAAAEEKPVLETPWLCFSGRPFQNMYISDYAPSGLIKSLHGLPRFGYQNFFPSIHAGGQAWRNYATGVGYNAGFVMVVGTLAFLVAIIVYASACCCRCCTCCKRSSKKEGLWMVSVAGWAFRACENCAATVSPRFPACGLQRPP
jgi:hypothetical protein